MTDTYPELTLYAASDPVLGHVKDLQSDLIAHMEHIAQQGDFVKVRYAHRQAYFVNTPALAHEFLVRNARHFHKPLAQKKAFTDISGENVFTADGAFWHKQHRLMQPTFHSRRIGAYADDIVSLTDREMRHWADGARVDMDEAMTEVTMRIIVKTMFDVDLDSQIGDPHEIGALMSSIGKIGGKRFRRAFNYPIWVPTPENRQNARLRDRIHDVIDQIIAQWRQQGEDRGDLLSSLMMARYEDDTPMSDEQIRNELITIFFAGHDTTATTLTVVWYMLSQHPTVRATLLDEVDTVLAGRTPKLDDLKDLPYTEQVIKEALRLYPITPGSARQATEDIEIFGQTVKEGELMWASPWIIHRRADVYENPEAFDPSRWEPEREKALPKGAFLPFGAGPRVCIGRQFAMMEARLVLARMSQRLTFDVNPGYHFQPDLGFTLALRGGLPMTVRARGAVRTT